MRRIKQLHFPFYAFAEDAPGPIWKYHFDRFWPEYNRWFLRYGEHDRPTYFESMQALERYMPEMVPIWEAMVELAGGGDYAARFLAQYNPPPLFRGCSQAIYRADEPVMVRSYDYSPYIFDGLLMRSRFRDRAVIGMLDCMSGLLDGINSDGLAVSMSFGGREEFSDGFGISMVIRYLLECAGDVAEAGELIRRVPVQGAYNLMLLDRAGNFETVALTPGRDPVFLGDPVATNHQADSHWPLYEEKVHTHTRYKYLVELVSKPGHTAYSFAREFLKDPLYHRRFGHGFGTLYDAAFYPGRTACEYFWPDMTWAFDFHTPIGHEYHATFVDPDGFPSLKKPYDEVYTSKPIPVLQF